jgi:glucose-1-phosphate adenylyltransferase
MGIYLFKTETLLNILNTTQEDDFGRDIIPHFLEKCRVYAYPYSKFNKIRDYVSVSQESGERQSELVERTRDSGYWRDVGTLDQYWNASMDLTGVEPYFSLYGTRWPIHTYQRQLPPAKFIFANERSLKKIRVGKALDSLVASGCIISGIVRNSILSHSVIISSWAEVDESVIFDNVRVGRYSRIKKAIVDKNNVIPPNTEIGYRPKEDAKRFTVTPRGITVVPKGYFKQ